MSQKVTVPGITTGKGMQKESPKPPRLRERPVVTNGRKSGYDYDPPAEGKIPSPFRKGAYREEPTPRREVQMGYGYEPEELSVDKIPHPYALVKPSDFERPADWPSPESYEKPEVSKPEYPAKENWFERFNKWLETVSPF